MRTRNLAVACGMVMSLAMASAFAQNEQPRNTQPNQPNQPTPPATSQPVPRDDSTLRVRSSLPEGNATGQAPTLLQDLQGVWRVEVNVAPSFWSMHGQDGMKDPNDPLRNNDPNRVDPSRDTGRNNEQKPVSDPGRSIEANKPPNNQPANNQNDPNNRANQPSDIAGGKQFVGYAETRLVMGNNILQQNIVIPDMLHTGMGRTPGRVDGAPAAAPGIGADQMYRGMSFIAFDTTSNAYTCAFLDSRSGKIHCDSGSYDESGKRLVFDGRDTSGKMNDGQKMGHENVRVVVEVLSPTQHRVTMYQMDGSGPARITPDRDANKPDATKPDATRPDQKPARDANRDLKNESWRTGAIVYQATFTKASGDDASKYRRLIAEPGTSPATDSDRKNPADLDRTIPESGKSPADADK